MYPNHNARKELIAELASLYARNVHSELDSGFEEGQERDFQSGQRFGAQFRDGPHRGDAEDLRLLLRRQDERGDERELAQRGHGRLLAGAHSQTVELSSCAALATHSRQRGRRASRVLSTTSSDSSIWRSAAGPSGTLMPSSVRRFFSSAHKRKPRTISPCASDSRIARCSRSKNPRSQRGARSEYARITASVFSGSLCPTRMTGTSSGRPHRNK